MEGTAIDLGLIVKQRDELQQAGADQRSADLGHKQQQSDHIGNHAGKDQQHAGQDLHEAVEQRGNALALRTEP